MIQDIIKKEKVNELDVRAIKEDIGDQIWNFVHSHPGCNYSEIIGGLTAELKREPNRNELNTRLTLMVDRGSIEQKDDKYFTAGNK